MCSIVKNIIVIFSITCFSPNDLLMCNASRLLCQSFDASTKSLEMYGERFKGIVPFQHCTNNHEAVSIKSTQVTHLKIGGCDCDVVADAIDKFKFVRNLDISYSYGYESLDWLHLKLDWLKRFNASHIELATLPSHFFQYTTYLLEVDLSHNKLRRIDSMAFHGAKKLTKINLSYNQIWIIHFGAVDHLKDLEHIDLRWNRITSLRFLSKNRKLNVIHVEENPITEFYCMHSVMSVVSLFMSWKNIRLIYGCMRLYVVHDNNYEAILPISMDRNQQQQQQRHAIHCNQSSFENLQKFIAGRHAFENVADMLWCVGMHVTNIDLSGNSLAGWDAFTLHRFYNLQMLDLCDTMLRYFDLNMIKNYSRLQRVDISNNQLDHIENVALLQYFVNLRVFITAGNRLWNVHEIIHFLPSSIEFLDLSESFVGELNAISLLHLTALKTLKLRHTQLTIVHGFNPFEVLNNLMHLDISHNNLSDVNLSTLLKPLTKLNALNVAFCDIHTQFLAMASQLRIIYPLRMLNISGNNIGVALDEHSLQSFANLEYLNMSNTSLSIATAAAAAKQNSPFGGLRKLVILDISKNNLEKINFSTISINLRQLFELNVAHYHIRNASDLTQHMGSSLIRIDLSGNLLLPPNMHTFQTLSNLMFLDLSNSNLTMFNIDILRNQTHLIELRLANNNLREIRIQSKLPYLSKLDLHGNNLMSINKLLQKQTDTLQDIAISSNRFPCIYLNDLMRKWTQIRFIDDPWNQKNEEKCHHT